MTSVANFYAPLPVRPLLHFTPPTAWMNDPNGLVYFDGEYHLFYQYHPEGLEWGPMHWGHAVSRNMIDWQHLDIALFPDERGMCFSGSAIVDHNDSSGLFDGQPGLLLFYTAHRVTGSAAEDYEQDQCIAYSCDKGRSWQKYAGNPVIPVPGFRDFRDPKVIWHEASQHWVMALACGQTIRFYRSENLLDWALCSEFGEHQGSHTEGPWECPDLFELPVEGGTGSRWVLVVGVGAGEDSWGSFTQYFIGDFDGTHFHNENAPDKVLLMDHSRDFYAVQSWSDAPDNRRIAIAWINNWLYANHIPENGWRGMMTIPREIRLVATTEGVRIGQRFVPELGEQRAWQRTMITCGAVDEGGQLALTAVQERIKPVHGSISFAIQPESCIGLYLSQPEQPDLTFRRTDSGLIIRYQRAGQNGNDAFDRFFPCHFDLPIVQSEASVTLEWISDNGSLELLINDGIYSLTSLQLCQSDSVVDNMPKLRVVSGGIEITGGQTNVLG
ncbi:glycoside hydrolase family 32 protein [Amphritea atlantica]|nr:glycoside hydrolase family 32 protein [Amphritea atlantica]